MLNQAQVWINGRLSQSLSPYDRGLNYGHGLFETIRVFLGEIPYWCWHKKRLELGCLRLGLTFDVRYLDDWLSEFKQNKLKINGRLKIVLTAGESKNFGYSQFSDSCTCIIFWTPVDLPFFKPLEYLGFCDAISLSRQPLLAGIKHTSRLEQILFAQWLKKQNLEEALICDTDGWVIEALQANVFWKKKGKFFTTDLSFAGVQGVMRQYILDMLFKSSAAICEIIETNVQEIENAEAIFLTSAFQGVRPVARFRSFTTTDFACVHELWKKLPGFGDS
jgi:4-amino-4-deoxychorismate lyase